MTNLDSILKSRGITLPTKVHLVKAMVFPEGSIRRTLKSHLAFVCLGFFSVGEWVDCTEETPLGCTCRKSLLSCVFSFLQLLKCKVGIVNGHSRTRDGFVVLPFGISFSAFILL